MLAPQELEGEFCGGPAHQLRLLLQSESLILDGGKQLLPQLQTEHRNQLHRYSAEADIGSTYYSTVSAIKEHDLKAN